MTNGSRLDQIAACGVVGAGGGGFPTHVKLAARAEHLILNAAECEPLLHKDKEILRHFGREVLAGAALAAELVGASALTVGIKGKYADLIAELAPLLPPGGRIAALSDSYPSGDELILVYDVTGRVVPPGGLPIHVGCVVLNVETALNLGRATPVVDKFLTIAGAVRSPVTVRVPIGARVGEVLELAGGAVVENPRVLAGGAMMGRLAALDEPVTKTCGGLLVLPEEHFLVRRYSRSWPQAARIGASACDQCRFCTDFCPRYLLGHPIEPHAAMRALGFVANHRPQVMGTQFCCECNLCSLMACPEDLDPKSVCAQSKRQLAAAAGSATGPATAWRPDAHPRRAALLLNDRRVPMGRLIQKLGLRGFANEGPLIESRWAPARVVLPLKQHAGAAARPVVTDGTRVQRGDLLARPADGALGACLHASIAGVCRVEAESVIIDTGQAAGGRRDD